MTDAVIQFDYSDGVHLSSFYKRSDTFTEDIINKFQEFCNKIDLEEQYATGRLNWGYIVSRLICDFVRYVDRNDNIKMVPEASDEDGTFIYRWIISPIEDKFRDNNIPLIETLYFDITYQISKRTEYKGLLSEFKPK